MLGASSINILFLFWIIVTAREIACVEHGEVLLFEAESRRAGLDDGRVVDRVEMSLCDTTLHELA
jgi:hypothetical protein